MMNSRDRKILIGFVIILVLFAVGIGVRVFMNKDTNTTTMTNGERFKSEYEALNGKLNESSKMTYPEVSINAKNPIKYLNEEQTIDLIKNKTGIIYFGFNSCPWCRTMIPMLLKAAESTGLGEINYLDIKDIRDVMVLDDNDKPVTKTEGSKGYKELLKAMDSVLDDYYLTNSDNEKIHAGEKRLYAPTVIAVKDGKIIDIHVDTVSTQKTGYTPLSQKEQEELFQIYQEMMLKMLGSSCNESC